MIRILPVQSALWLGLVLLLSACARPPLPLPEAASRTRQQAVWQRHQQIDSLQALATVRSERAGKRWRSTQALHVQRPGRIRLEVFRLLGQPVLDLAVDGAFMEVCVPSQQACYNGLSSRERIDRFTGVPLAAPDLVALLLGQLPRAVVALGKPRWQADGLWWLTADGPRYRVVLSDSALERIECYQGEQLLYQVDYSAPDAADGFPRRIVMLMPDRQLRLELKLEEVRLNPALPAALFRLQVPSGSELLPLELLQ